MSSDEQLPDPDALWRPPDPERFDDEPGATGPHADETTNTDVPRDPDAPFTIAIVSVQGVLFDQWWAFRSVLALWPGARTINVGSVVGLVGGAGGSVDVQATYDEVPHADIVVIPGGLGVEAASRDPQLCRWLRRTAPSARWVLASSTGSVVLAAAGLLGGQPAATFWLAADLLAEHGSEKVPDRIHVSDDRVVTCAGSASAFEAACLVIERELGPDAIARIRAQLVEPADEHGRSRSRRLLPRVHRHQPVAGR